MAVLSISRRTAVRTARILGVASASAALALSAAGSALACNISEFSAEAKCDGTKGVITVTEEARFRCPGRRRGFLRRTARLEEDRPAIGQRPREGPSPSPRTGPGSAGSPPSPQAGNLVHEDIKPNLTTLSTACKTEDTPTPTPTPTPSDSASTPAEETDSPTPSATPSENESTAPAGTVEQRPVPRGRW
ncbi:hypothetical protein SALBM311S_06872 [Streptomyces alboniger]